MTALKTPTDDAPAAESGSFIARAQRHYSRLEELERMGQFGTRAYRQELTTLRKVQHEQSALADEAFAATVGRVIAEGDEVLVRIAGGDSWAP